MKKLKKIKGGTALSKEEQRGIVAGIQIVIQNCPGPAAAMCPRGCRCVTPQGTYCVFSSGPREGQFCFAL